MSTALPRPFVYKAKLNRVVDGDTVILDIDLGFRIFTSVKARLGDIDAPERGQPGHLEAKSGLEDMLTLKHLIVETFEQDKYGRWIVWIWTNPHMPTVNKRMVNRGLAKNYDGLPS